MQPILQNEQNEIAIMDQFSGIYTVDELTDYFQTLRYTLTSIDYPVTLILRNSRTRMAIGYRPKKDDRTKSSTWVFIHANQLPGRIVESDDEIASLVLSSFSHNQWTTFETKLYVTAEHAQNMESHLSDWHNHVLWKKIHSITPHKANLLDSEKTSWLLIASYISQPEVVKALLDQDANPNQAQADGRSPLFMAALSGDLEAIEMLLQKGADPNQLERGHGWTPLSAAASYGHADVVSVLLKYGANPTLEALDSTTPLYLAAGEGHLEIVKLLLANEANPNHAKKNGDTPLLIATRKGYIDIVKALLEYGADPYQAHTDNRTASLLYAAERGYLEIVNILLDLHVDPNQARKDGTTPLILAASNGQCEIVKALLANGANPNQTDNTNSSPLFVAAYDGHLEVVSILLNAGAIPNQIRSDGATPLFKATENGHLEVIKLLLKKYADAKNSLTPIHHFPRGQKWFIRCMQSMTDHVSLEGNCAGVSAMGMLAILFDDFVTFQKQWVQVHDILYPIITIAKSEALKELGYDPTQSFEKILQKLWGSKKETLFSLIQNKVIETIRTLDPSNEYHFAGIKDFLDKVHYYQQNQQSFCYSQNENSTSLVDEFSGIYTFNELIEYFRMLHRAFVSAKYPVTFLLIDADHAITVGYIKNIRMPKEKIWVFIDANQLPGQEIEKEEEIATKVLSAFSANECTAFHTRIYVNQIYKEDAASRLKDLHINTAAKKLQRITLQKTKQMDSKKGSWLLIAIGADDKKLVKTLLDKGADPNQIREDRITPLFLSILKGNIVIIKTLLNHGADPNQRTAKSKGTTPLFLAVKGGNLEIVNALLEHNADPNQEGENTTPLYKAAAEGYLEIVNALLEKKADPNKGMTTGATPLYAAVQNNHFEVIKALLDYHADPNQTMGYEKAMPLYRAAERGHSAVVNMLLTYGADPNRVYLTHTPLLVAIKNKHLEVIKILLEKNANPNQAVDTSTPLFLAVKNNSLGIVQVLLAYGANPNQIENAELNPLLQAVENGHIEIVKALLEKKAEPNLATYSSGVTPLISAAMNGQLEILKLLLKKGANPNQVSSDGTTPLSAAAANDQLEITNILLDQKGIFDPLPSHAMSPLFAASQNGCLEIAKILLAHGINPNQASHRGMTPLYAAVQYGHDEMVKLLLTHGANLILENDKNYFLIAAENGYIDILKLLIHSAEMAAREKLPQTIRTHSNVSSNLEKDRDKHIDPLNLACATGDLKLVKKLIKQDRTYHDTRLDLSLLPNACQSGNSKVVEFLLANGFDVHINNEESLSVACEKGDLPLVKYLLKQGADIHGENDRAFRSAVNSSQFDLADYLLQQGANIHSNNDCALRWTSYKGKLNAVKFLLDHGADIHAEKDDALYQAGKKGHLEVVKYLVEHGADIHTHEDELLGLACERGNVKVAEYLMGHNSNTDKENKKLLYKACKSGNVDMIKLLLNKISSSNDNQFQDLRVMRRPTKPYSIRAYYEWIVDNALLPVLAINPRYPGCQIPTKYIDENEMLFNLSPSAIRNLKLDNDIIQFSAAYEGVIYAISIPIEAIQALYAEENNKGIFFDNDKQDQLFLNANGKEKTLISKEKPSLQLVKKPSSNPGKD